MKKITINSDPEYEVVARRMEELKNAPAGSNPAKELKCLAKAVIHTSTEFCLGAAWTLTGMN